MAGEWTSTRSARINPGVGGKKVKIDTRDLALMAISASLYASINIVQTSMGGPITYGPIQLRLADCLIPLSALLGWPLALGVTIGCFSNAYYWLSWTDIVVGPIVNFAAAFLILLLRRNRPFACVSGSFTVGIPIGLYLYYLYLQGNPAMQQVPNLGVVQLPIWSAFVVSLSISSIIIIAGVGYILLKALSRPNIIEPLRSHGLKVLSQNHQKKRSSFVSPIISSKSKPKASRTWSNVECR